MSADKDVAEPLYHQYALRPQSELSPTQAELSLELKDTCYRLSTQKYDLRTDFLTYHGPHCLPSKNPATTQQITSKTGHWNMFDH